MEDVARLLRAQQNHNQRAFRKVMTKYAASWKALSPSAKAAVQAAVTPNQEGAVAGLAGTVCRRPLWPLRLAVYFPARERVRAFRLPQ